MQRRLCGINAEPSHSHCQTTSQSIRFKFKKMAPSKLSGRGYPFFISLLENGLFNFVMFIGLVCGCCPALLIPSSSTRFINSVPDRPYKNYIGFLYCVAAWIFMSLSPVDFIIAYGDGITTRSTSSILLTFLTEYMITLVDLVRRSIFLFK